MLAARLFGLLVAAAPPVAVLASFCSGTRAFHGRLIVPAAVVFALGALVSLLNFYLSVLRGCFRRPGEPPLRHVSGLPLVGVLTVIGLWCLPPATAISCVAAACVLGDTGGVSWFVVAVWSDESFWRATVSRHPR